MPKSIKRVLKRAEIYKRISVELVNAVVEKSMQKSVPSVVRELGAPAKVPSRHRWDLVVRRDLKYSNMFRNSSQTFSIVHPL